MLIVRLPSNTYGIGERLSEALGQIQLTRERAEHFRCRVDSSRPRDPTQCLVVLLLHVTSLHH